ncbi:MAG: lysine transporter LysE [Chloroflexi bacterium]|nr:lysine transporter LysE [Chloroflexota bacterium]
MENVTVYLVQGIGYGFAAAVQPGPFQAYVIAQTLNNGWRNTLLAAFAPLISDGPIVALVLLVLSQVPQWMQRFLYVASGLFVLYLAVNAFIGWRDFDTAGVAASPSGQQSLSRAAIMNVLSPGPYIYWSLVTGPILLAGCREAPANGIGFLAGFYAAMILTLAGIIVLFGTARHLGPKVNRAMLGISVVALACFGLYQLWLGISGM